MSIIITLGLVASFIGFLHPHKFLFKAANDEEREKKLKAIRGLSLRLLAMFALLLILLIVTTPAKAESIEDIVSQMQDIDNSTWDEMRCLVDDINSNKEAIRQAQRELLDGRDVYNPEDDIPEIYTSNSNLLIFISSSMPEDVIRRYMEQSPDGTLFVIKGLIGEDLSKLMPTVKYISKLICGTDKILANTVCLDKQVDINPVLFEMFNVTTVPTFIQTSRSIAQIANDEQTGDYKVMKGAVSLKYVMDKFNGGKHEKN